MSGPPRTVLVVDAGAAGSTRDAIESKLGDHDAVDVECVTESVAGVIADREAASGGPAAVFALGEPSLLALAAAPPDCPVFVVDDGAGRYDASAAGVGAAVDAAATGAFETAPHPVLDVAVDGESVGAAVADVSLVTAEPARISEYAVGADRWGDTVRADGVVVTTPLGSEGYAHAAGGPLLAPGSGLAVVPISPYAMHADAWVLQPPVTLSVERDEAAVSLLLDDAVAQTVPAGAPVDVAVGGTLALARPESFESD